MEYIVFSLMLAIVAALVVGSNNRVRTIAFVLAFVILSVLNYFVMPTMAFWGFEGVWLELGFVLTGSIVAHFALLEPEPEKQTWSYGYYEEEEPKKETPTWPEKVRWGVVALFILAVLVACFQSWECFHAKKFSERLEVKVVSDTTFTKAVKAIDVQKMIAVDAELARKVAEDKLGQEVGLGSRTKVGKMTLQSISGEFTIQNGKKLVFNDAMIYIAPLEHSSFWKFVSNKTTPGYLIVDATDQTKVWLVTEVNGQKLKLKYIESAAFGTDIERHIKANGYAHRGITDFSFEIDNSGHPFWVLSYYSQYIGFAGEEAEGVITVDAQSGDLKAYTIAQAPEWIDRIQPEEFVRDQIRCWGEYKKGWWNSFVSQVGVQEPTQGTSLVWSEGRSYWYTGIKSAGADAGTNGFMLVDTRTKEATLYRSVGVDEEEARSIAEDLPFSKAANYRATYPILYNVRGIPTYFMVMKGSSGNVVGYSFVAISNRQAVGAAASKQEAEKEYLRMLKKTAQDKIKDGDVTSKSETLIIRGITSEGSTYYILFEEIKGVEFTGTTEFFPELKWSKVGNKVKVSYRVGSDKVISLDGFDNLDFEI